MLTHVSGVNKRRTGAQDCEQRTGAHTQMFGYTDFALSWKFKLQTSFLTLCYRTFNSVMPHIRIYVENMLPCQSYIFNFLNFCTKLILVGATPIGTTPPPTSSWTCALIFMAIKWRRARIRQRLPSCSELLARAGAMNALSQSYVQQLSSIPSLLVVVSREGPLSLPILNPSIQRRALLNAYFLTPLLISWLHVNSKCGVDSSNSSHYPQSLKTNSFERITYFFVTHSLLDSPFAGGWRSCNHFWDVQQLVHFSIGK